MNATGITAARPLAEDSPPDVRAPIVPRTPRLWAGVALLLTGLALIGLGGCFLYGVLEAVNANARAELEYKQIWIQKQNAFGSSWTDRTAPLQNILYVLAWACFIGAAIVLSVGVRGLRRLMQEENKFPLRE